MDEHPVSIQVNGQWQTFPNAKAAEEASYEEYKANLRHNAQNFRITDEHLGEGGPKAKFQANIEAIKLLKYLEETTAQATPEQQEVLSRYVGWGGLADAFDPKTGMGFRVCPAERAADPGGICRRQKLHPQRPLHQPYGHSGHL